MNLRSTLLLSTIAAALIVPSFAAPASAATCTVDPTGALGGVGTYPGVNAALAPGACDAPGSVIEIWCPAGTPCDDHDIVVDALTDITIRSMEPDGGGPVRVIATGPGPAVEVTDSSGIVFEGISQYVSPHAAVQVSDSGATFTGPTIDKAQRYGDLQGNVGMAVAGGSDVTLRWMGVRDAALGLLLVQTADGSPAVDAAGLALLENDMAAELLGPPVGCGSPVPPAELTISGDFGTAWLNYVMGNLQGFHLHEHSLLRIDHTVLASNLYQMVPGGLNPQLFQVHQSSRLEGRNLLLYSNDMLPGLSGPYPGPPNAGTAGSILEHDSCDSSSFLASTFVNNATDVIFGMGGSGKLTLDHTLVAGGWGKVLSMSGWYTSHGNTCPPLTTIASNFRGNRVNADPAVCMPGPPGLGTGWNPGVTVSPNTPETLAAYPQVPAPYMDLYLINRRQPMTYALPPGLYDGRPWTVDGVHPDKKRLDVGYHNPG